MKKRILLLTLALFIVCCGCGEPQEPIEMLGTTCDNIVINRGQFCFSNDFIYFWAWDDAIGDSRIFEYDLETGKAVGLRSTGDDVKNLFVSGGRIYYVSGDSLKSVTKSGQKPRTVFSREGKGCWALTVYDNTAYFLDTVGGNLFSRNLADGSEQKLLSNVFTYHIGQGEIYALVDENDHRDLYISDLEQIDFQKAELDMDPIVISAGGTVYVSEAGTYQMFAFADGQLSQLPMRATFYTIVGNTIFYLDADTYADSGYTLTAYDTETGKKETVFENVCDFNVLEDRYICMRSFGGNNRMNNHVLDRLTGEHFTMLER